MSQKPVLLFAHRGEAHAFLNHAENLHSLNQTEIQAYESKHYFILITNEGIQETTENLTYFLANHKEQVSHVINLGVAGALDSSLAIDQIYKIKTIYGEEQFKSFQTSDKTGIDLISAKNRVNKPEMVQKLLLTAPLVDREAWAMASVTKKIKKDFSCYKIISDFANQDNVCDLVKEKASILSEKLFHYYKELHFDSSIEIPTELTLPGFHFTFTQQKQLENILSRLSLKENKTQSSFLEGQKTNEIARLKISPKEKAQILIHELTMQLNPFKKNFEDKLNQATLPLTQIGCRLKFTENYENKNFTISMPIENEKNYLKLKEALTKINYQDITKILDGDF